MIRNEGQPALFRVRCRRRPVIAEVLADGARGDLNAQLELSPGRILGGNFSDESAQVFGQARSTSRP
jgi:hypothetical protein